MSSSTSPMPGSGPAPGNGTDPTWLEKFVVGLIYFAGPVAVATLIGFCFGWLFDSAKSALIGTLVIGAILASVPWVLAQVEQFEWFKAACLPCSLALAFGLILGFRLTNGYKAFGLLFQPYGWGWGILAFLAFLAVITVGASKMGAWVIDASDDTVADANLGNPKLFPVVAILGVIALAPITLVGLLLTVLVAVAAWSFKKNNNKMTKLSWWFGGIAVALVVLVTVSPTMPGLNVLDKLSGDKGNSAAETPSDGVPAPGESSKSSAAPTPGKAATVEGHMPAMSVASCSWTVAAASSTLAPAIDEVAPKWGGTVRLSQLAQMHQMQNTAGEPASAAIRVLITGNNPLTPQEEARLRGTLLQGVTGVSDLLKVVQNAPLMRGDFAGLEPGTVHLVLVDVVNDTITVGGKEVPVPSSITRGGDSRVIVDCNGAAVLRKK